MPPQVAEEVCAILVACTQRYRKVREVALGYARQILETFSALMCDRLVVFTLLEILTLMRRSCELQYTDEVSWVSDGDRNLELMTVLASVRVQVGQDGHHAATDRRLCCPE